MKVCVLGLWHLGSVTAACLASLGHQVTGLDFDAENVRCLNHAIPPVAEPGLSRLIQEGLGDGRLLFTNDIQTGIAAIDVLWVTYDTPVDDADRADPEFVLERVERVLAQFDSPVLVVISSQLPVGSTRILERKYPSASAGPSIRFACLPENLRLGEAIADFMKPGRVVIGIRDERDRALLETLCRGIAGRIEWMSVESAEMTKHALNAFLAASVAFINEVAVLCETVGADAEEVERGLKGDARIGAKAYLSPGAAFAGGTLARDVSFLVEIGRQREFPAHLLRGICASNDDHRLWVRRKIAEVLGELSGKVVAVWGLTYKPGTDTLRRSPSLELCDWLAAAGALVQAHDPAIGSLPPAQAASVVLARTALDAVRGAGALVVATAWPEYRVVAAAAILSEMRDCVIVDPGRLLAKQVAGNPAIRYFTVGKP